jgi:hypothetical protein
MSWLRSMICDWFHAGGRIKRDAYDRINWQCDTCGRWAEPVDKKTEELIIESHITKAIRARESK